MATFITDLDGTLLCKYNVIKPYSIKVIKQAIENGHDVYFATGRNYHQVEPIIRKYRLSVTGIICLNGASVYTKETYPDQPLNAHIMKEIISLFNNSDDYFISIHTKDKVYRKATIKTMIKLLIKKILRYGDYKTQVLKFKLKLPLATDIYKIEIQGNSEKIKKLYTQLTPQYFNQYEIALGSIDNMEITAKDVNKLEAILKIADKNNIALNNIYVFGDGGNDQKMLAYFKNSYAPTDALKIAKEAACFSCKTNEEEGVAKIIEQVCQEINKKEGKE